jgi:hypothetical protein
MPQEVAGRAGVVELLHEARRRALALGRHRAGHGRDGGAVVLDRLQKVGHHGLAFAFQDAVDGALGVLQRSGAVKEALWPPTKTKAWGRISFAERARSTTSGTFAR